MRKSIYTHEHEVVLRQLRQARLAAGLTQVELAIRLGADQAWVSRVETGERRLDIVQLRAYCAAMDLPILEFMHALEAALTSPVSTE